MPAGNSADRICHGQNSETECEGDPEQADANLRKCGGKHRTTATAENKPTRPEKFCTKLLEHEILSRNPLHGGLTVADARTLYLHQFRFREQPLFCECIELRLRCKEALQRDPV